ncbi:MAG: J domain-containing protein [Proteobacteria bacterium]|nr:J domain-containing protein [Pseudomonadota bacterium]
MAIRFTHGYDLLHKLGSMLGGLFVVVAAGDLLERITYPIQRYLEHSGLVWVWGILVLAYAIGGYIGAIALVNRTVLPYWLPTYLHVRFSLFTMVTPAEAERLSFLFDGSLWGRWYPCGAFRKIDKEFRREALFRFANKIADENGLRRPFVMPEDRFAETGRRQTHGASTSQQASAAQSAADARVEECLNMLGLSEMPSTFAAIKTAYRCKIGVFHPDKYAGEKPEMLQYAEEMSKKLNVAYAYLEQRFAGSMP